MSTTTAEAFSTVSAPEEAQCELPVQGMTCASCVLRVERALRATPGVQDAHVNFVARRASVSDDPTAATPAALVQAIEAAGYEVPRAQEVVTAELPATKKSPQRQKSLRASVAIRHIYVTPST